MPRTCLLRRLLREPSKGPLHLCTIALVHHRSMTEDCTGGRGQQQFAGFASVFASFHAI